VDDQVGDAIAVEIAHRGVDVRGRARGLVGRPHAEEVARARRGGEARGAAGAAEDGDRVLVDGEEIEAPVAVVVGGDELGDLVDGARGEVAEARLVELGADEVGRARRQLEEPRARPAAVAAGDAAVGGGGRRRRGPDGDPVDEREQQLGRAVAVPVARDVEEGQRVVVGEREEAALLDEQRRRTEAAPAARVVGEARRPHAAIVSIEERRALRARWRLEKGDVDPSGAARRLEDLRRRRREARAAPLVEPHADPPLAPPARLRRLPGELAGHHRDHVLAPVAVEILDVDADHLPGRAQRLDAELRPRGRLDRRRRRERDRRLSDEPRHQPDEPPHGCTPLDTHRLGVRGIDSQCAKTCVARAPVDTLARLAYGQTRSRLS